VVISHAAPCMGDERDLSCQSCHGMIPVLIKARQSVMQRRA
jgi:hypothetical protein